MRFGWPDMLVPSPHPPDVSSLRVLLNMSRCVREWTDACCWKKQQQTDNNRLKISRGLNNYLQIAYLAFQCLPVLYQVRHFRYRYRNRYRFSISIGSIGGVGGIVLTLVLQITLCIMFELCLSFSIPELLAQMTVTDWQGIVELVMLTSCH